MANVTFERCEWCLRRNSSASRKYGTIPLPVGTEMSLGRGLDVTVQLLSKKNHLMLSRKHAIFKEIKDGQWTVVDNKSLNGVQVNSIRIVPLTPHPLKLGDRVQLGVLADGDDQAEFVFTIVQESHSAEETHKLLHLCKVHKGSRAEQPRGSQDSQTVIPTANVPGKRKVYNVGSLGPSDTAGPSGNPCNKRTKLVTDHELSESLRNERNEAEKKAVKAREQFKELTRMLAEQQSIRLSLEEQLKQREVDINRELESEKEELENKKAQLKEEMQRSMLLHSQQKEQELQDQLKMHEDDLANEKIVIEDRLKTQWEKRLQDQEVQLQRKQEEMKSFMESKVQEKEVIMMDQLKSQREDLMKEKQRLEAHLHEEWSRKLEEKDQVLCKMQDELRLSLEEKIRKKEDTMMEQLKSQKETLQAEKARVEKSLQEEMERKLEMKDKDLQAGLEKEKMKLDEVIANKEREYAQLQTELAASKLEKADHDVCIQKAKEEALQTIYDDVMETELQCSVCSELFIQAITLGCSHSFCQYCIHLWMKRKNDCPVCRASITSRSRSIVLDNYIERMIERLANDLQERRKEIVQERKSLIAKDAPSTTAPPKQPNQQPQVMNPIVISDNSDDDSDDDEHYDDEEEDDDGEDDDDEDDGYEDNRYFNRYHYRRYGDTSRFEF